VIVVGAGLAGLAAATELQKAGVPFILLEASDGVGGRVRTDEVDGFLLDRGFQIFLTSYPECKELLDYAALDLRPFYAGASVRFENGWHRVADPVRHLTDGVASLVNPIGGPIDKIRVGLFRLKSLAGGTYDFLRAPETSTLQQLQAEGFSEAIIDRFFRPFLGGIFFDNQLRTSSRLTSFVMRMLATGSNCLPAQGIGAITEQLASRLPADSIRLDSPVTGVSSGSGGSEGSVRTRAGATLSARRGVIVAAEGPAAAKLLGDRLASAPSQAADGVGTCCLYFTADAPPSSDPMLYLNGDGGGVVNNVCFPSTVASTYAPAGKTLVSVAVVGTRPDMSDEQLTSAVVQQLRGWWGGQVDGWRHLRTYRIPFAQPNQAPPTALRRDVDLGSGVFVCGDHRDTATFDGAMLSGRRAAKALLAGGR